jgi:hypothetical protein
VYRFLLRNNSRKRGVGRFGFTREDNIKVRSKKENWRHIVDGSTNMLIDFSVRQNFLNQMRYYQLMKE